MSALVIPVNVQIPSAATAPIVADFVEHALRVAYVNRRDVDRLPTDEWGVPGIYVLLTGDGSHQVYVGQAVDLRKRLLQHRLKPKLDWLRVVAIKRDRSHGFNSAESGYLEGRVAAEVAAIPEIAVVAGRLDQDTTLPPHMLLSLDGLLSSIIAALRLAGVDTFKVADLPEDSGKRRARRSTPTVDQGTVPDLLAAGLLRAGASVHLSPRRPSRCGHGDYLRGGRCRGRCRGRRLRLTQQGRGSGARPALLERLDDVARWKLRRAESRLAASATSARLRGGAFVVEALRRSPRVSAPVARVLS